MLGDRYQCIIGKEASINSTIPSMCFGSHGKTFSLNFNAACLSDKKDNTKT